MVSRFAFHERWEGFFIVSVGIICIVVICILRILGIDYAPARFQNFLAAHLELYLFRLGSVFVDDLAQYGGGREFTIRIEHADESLGDEIIHVCLHIGESGWRNTGWDDGVVVGYLAVIEYLLALRQLLAGGGELLDERQIFLLTSYLCLAHTIQNLRTFRIDIVCEKLGIYTRIRGIFLLVETLDELQRNIGGVSKLLVAIHLQRGEVVKMRGRLVSLFLAYIGNGEGFAGDGAESLLAFLLAGKLAAGSRKLGVAIDGGEYPVRFGNEVVDFLLSVYDKGKGRGLHSADAEHLSILTIFQCIKSGGIHAENPVTDGTGKSGKIERLIFPLVFQFLESLLDGFIGHG